MTFIKHLWSVLKSAQNYAHSFLTLTSNAQKNKSLWAISLMSFFSGCASVMVFSILPLYMTQELRLSYKEVGYIEGIAIFFAFLTKIFSGILSDFLKRRKPIILIGAFLSLVIKPIFALSTGFGTIFLAKSLDRFAKGVRSAPTEALIGDLSEKNKEGISYGIRYTLYALGFMCGGALSSLIMHLKHNQFRFVFWSSLIPATIAFFILLFFVKEYQPAEHEQNSKRKKEKIAEHFRNIYHLPLPIWHLMAVIFLLMLARFSDSFLHYRGQELGFSLPTIPLIMILYNLIEAIAPFPIGKLADRLDRSRLLLYGILVLVLANTVVLCVTDKVAILFGVGLAGLHMGMTQGLLGTLVSSLTPSHLRGTGFAIFYLMIGIAAPLGNFMAGHLAEISKQYGFGVRGAFFWGLLSTILASIYLHHHFLKKRSN